MTGTLTSKEIVKASKIIKEHPKLCNSLSHESWTKYKKYEFKLHRRMCDNVVIIGKKSNKKYGPDIWYSIVD
jgi:hypothetical protein